MYKIEGLGWLPDLPDDRDLTLDDNDAIDSVSNTETVFALTAPKPKKENIVDLREYCTKIENQGNLGSCTSQAIVGLVEYIQKRAHNQHIEGSRLYLYYCTRYLLGWLSRGDTGAFVRSTIKALRLFGIAPEQYWPYNIKRFNERPTPEVFTIAGNYKALRYHRLRNLKEVKDSLSKGIPCACGFPVFTNHMLPEAAKTGYIKVPNKGDKQVGGHAVGIFGYNDNTGHLLIRNSWGSEWGVDGYGFLPYEFVNRGLATDFWALTSTNYESLK